MRASYEDVERCLKQYVTYLGRLAKDPDGKDLIAQESMDIEDKWQEGAWRGQATGGFAHVISCKRDELFMFCEENNLKAEYERGVAMYRDHRHWKRKRRRLEDEVSLAEMKDKPKHNLEDKK